MKRTQQSFIILIIILMWGSPGQLTVKNCPCFLSSCQSFLLNFLFSPYLPSFETLPPPTLRFPAWSDCLPFPNHNCVSSPCVLKSCGQPVSCQFSLVPPCLTLKFLSVHEFLFSLHCRYCSALANWCCLPFLIDLPFNELDILQLNLTLFSSPESSACSMAS